MPGYQVKYSNQVEASITTGIHDANEPHRFVTENTLLRDKLAISALSLHLNHSKPISRIQDTRDANAPLLIVHLANHECRKVEYK